MTNAAISIPDRRPAADAGKLADKILIRGLDFYYGNGRALKGINLTLHANRVTAIIGPSGWSPPR